MDRRPLPAVPLVLLASAFALATVWFGWWSVPAVGAGWGIVARDTSRPALAAGLAAGSAWGALLLWSALSGPVWTLAGKLGAVAQVPGIALIGLTLLLPLALGAGGALAVRLFRW